MIKSFACFVFCLSFVIEGSATIHTLCNMPYSPGMFKTFAAAHDAAIDGDTIYVHGSTISYGDIDINKSLVIIGTGHRPAKQNALVSTFQYININIESVQLIGITFNYLYSGFKNSTIKRCRITGGNFGYLAGLMLYNGGGWLVEGNIFDLASNDQAIMFGFWSAPDAIIRNNIFSTPRNKITNLNNTGSQLTYFLNNVFLGNNAYPSFDLVQNAVLDNNIFIGSSPDATGLSNCQMNNNISYSCFDNTFNQPGFNNLVNVDPQFVNFSAGALFSYNYDFQLLNSSPGNNSGVDGTDRGVFGGVGLKFSMTGEPAIASITSFSISGPTTIPANGTLNITITSKKIH